MPLLALLFLVPYSANAAALYQNCILGGDFGDGISEVLEVTPVGKICKERCNNECNVLSRMQGNVELNSGIIARCKVACRNGDSFSTTSLKIPSGSSIVTDPTTYTTASSCSKSSTLKDNVLYPHETNTIVNVGDDLQIKLRSVNRYGDTVSMCGTRETVLTPNRFTTMKCSSPWCWNGTNYAITDTKVFVKDGDIVSISYTGKYKHWRCTGDIDSCPIRDTDRNLLVKKPSVNSFNPPYNDNNYDTLPGESLKVYRRNSDKSIDQSTMEEALNNNRNVSWNGLYAKLDMLYNDDDDAGVVDTIGTPLMRFAGVLDGFSPDYTKIGIQHYDGGGTENWDDNSGGYDVSVQTTGCIFTQGERLQYAITEEKPDAVASTPVSDRYQAPVESDWVDVPVNVMIQFEPLQVTKQGKVFFRIKPLDVSEDEAKMPTCSNSDTACLTDLADLKKRYEPGEGDGGYFLQIEKIANEGISSNILSDTVRDVRNYFFGTNGTGGMVQQLFNQLVANSDLVRALRALILLYITWTGLSFVIGVAQITQREGVMRSIYLGIVLMLLAPNSWEFFNTYLFQLFIDGGIQLMSYAINPPELGLPSNTSAQIQRDPALVFSVLDKPLAILFGKKTWIKIFALIMSSALGIAVALAVIFAGVIYAITILKAMIIYVVSLIMMSILLILAPVFISFILFKYTRQMFTVWLQQLASVTLQPVFVVLGLGIFSNLILTALYAALGFSVCSGCFLSFYIPAAMESSVCIIPTYYTVFSMHSPNGGIFSPVAAFSSVFVLLLLAHGAYVYCSKITDFINSMIAGFFQGIDLTGYSHISSYTSNYLHSVKGAYSYAMGRDRNTQAMRSTLKGYEGSAKSWVGGTVGGFAKGANMGVKATTGVDVGQKATDMWGNAFSGNKANPNPVAGVPAGAAPRNPAAGQPPAGAAARGGNAAGAANPPAARDDGDPGNRRR